MPRRSCPKKARRSKSKRQRRSRSMRRYRGKHNPVRYRASEIETNVVNALKEIESVENATIETIGTLDHKPRTDPVGRFFDVLAVDGKSRQKALDRLEAADAALSDPETRARAEAAWERVSQAPEIGQQAIAASRVITPDIYVVKCVTVTFKEWSINPRPQDVIRVIEEGGLAVFDTTREINNNDMRIFCYVDKVAGEGEYEM